MTKSGIQAIGLTLPFVAGAVLAFGAQRWQAARAASLLVANPSQVDLGSVPEGATALGKIRLVNRTDMPVRIARIETSCGCTSVSKIEVVGPRATATLSVRIATKGKHGAFREFVTIRYADVARSPLVIPLDASTAGATEASSRPEEPSEFCEAPKKK